MIERKSQITILMPVYNGAPYIQEAIDSILNQTFKDFKLLIINDGSTDATQTIIESYKDERIKSIQQSNMGVSRSLNKGLDIIETPYIRRHDADDISEPWMLEKQMTFLEEHPEISFVSTQCAFMTENSRISFKYRQPKQHLFENNDYIIVNKTHFNPYSPIVHGTVLGPTKIFKEFGGYRTQFLTSEDNDLWLRIIEKYKFAVLNACPYYLRLSGNSATKMHKTSVPFYRELAIKFAEERQQKGSDPIMRGEKIPEPYPANTKEIIQEKSHSKKGKLFRSDILNYQYRIFLNAKDWKLVLQSIKISLKDGWKVKQTWRGILFPLLGENLVKIGVKIKGLFK